MTEMYKVKNGIAPEIMKDIFEQQNALYNLRSSCNQFGRENIKALHYGLQSVRYLDPKIRKLVPNNINCNNSLSKFKKSRRGNQRYVPTGCVRHTLSK